MLSAFFSPEGSSCSPLVVGQHVITKESCTKAPSPPGTVCDLSCPENYKLVGPPFQQCGNGECGRHPVVLSVAKVTLSVTLRGRGSKEESRTFLETKVLKMSIWFLEIPQCG